MFRWWAEFLWVGATGAELVFALSASTVGPVAGMEVTVCCYFAGLVVLRRASARVRAGAREITTCVDLTSGPLPVVAPDSRCRALGTRLQDADEDLRSGRTDAVTHERIWFEVWEQLGEPERRVR